jgi:hypothetical protein
MLYRLNLVGSPLLLPTLFPQGVQHVFHHVVINIRQLFLRPAACLTSTLLETGVGAYLKLSGIRVGKRKDDGTMNQD